MIKGKELLGRHVVDLTTGERIDSVRDIVFDHGANLVLGLVVDGGGSWLRRRDRLIPFGAVYSVGEDAVMITSAQDAASPEEQARMKEIMDSDVNLIGMTLLTSQGEDLGRIGDVVFDEYSGRVEGYEVTGGLFADTAGGRSFVPAPESVQIGKDVALVPASVAEELRRSGGQWPSPQPSAEAPAPLHPDYSREELAEQAAQRQRDYLTGRIAGTTVTLPDGTVVAEKGQPITEEQVIRAERSGRLMVLTSTSLSPEEVEQASSGQGPAAEEALPEAAPAPAPLPTFSEMVGRRVREDVIDRQGHLIAAQGQIITPAVLTRAEELGMLEAVQQRLKGTESAAEPLDLGEYQRLSAEETHAQPQATPAQGTASAPPANQATETALSTEESLLPEESLPAEQPGASVPETALELGEVVAPDHSAPVTSAPVTGAPDTSAAATAAGETPAGAALQPDPDGPLIAVPALTQERPMRVREEQVVHLSDPVPGQEPGLLEKARRWLNDRREDLLHDPQERELVQVHEQWGAPITAAKAPAPEAQPQPHPAAEPQAGLSSSELEPDRAKTPVFGGPQPQAESSAAGWAEPGLSPAPLPAQAELEPTAPLSPAADPLQPAGPGEGLQVDESDLHAALAAPVPAPQPAAPAPAQAEPAADPLQPKSAATPSVPAEVSPPQLHPADQSTTPGPSRAEAESQAAIDRIVQQAYGWPVTRTIQTESGEVILPEGGRVTPAAVAEARRLGMLRDLLSAVQRGE